MVKQQAWVTGMAVLVAALLALTGVSQAAMWAGAELGFNFAIPRADLNGVNRGRTISDPAVIGGATLGYDFVNTGFGAYAWPEWMKYFSVATDITYNRLTVEAGSGPGSFPKTLLPGSRLQGSEVAWTFMLIGHYGLFPDSEVPAGRVNPYLGVGPAILWSGIGNLDTRFGHLGSGTATNVALVVEPGIRWMLLPQVSIDTAVRYRFAEPSWETNNSTVKFSPLHMFAFLVRANYHF